MARLIGVSGFGALGGVGGAFLTVSQRGFRDELHRAGAGLSRWRRGTGAARHVWTRGACVIFGARFMLAWRSPAVVGVQGACAHGALAERIGRKPAALVPLGPGLLQASAACGMFKSRSAPEGLGKSLVRVVAYRGRLLV